MVTVILIVIGLNFGFTQEFNSWKACNDAKAFMVQNLNKNSFVQCVGK